MLAGEPSRDAHAVGPIGESGGAFSTSAPMPTDAGSSLSRGTESWRGSEADCAAAQASCQHAEEAMACAV